jgi:peroxiredoxin
MTKIIHQSKETNLAQAVAEGESLWLDRDEIESATGWLWKPQGLCRDGICMPIPGDCGRRLAMGERLDMAGMWRYAGWPVARNRSGDLWVLGEGASRRAAALNSLQAPDFELPDLDGRLHRLSDYRGRKVFLVSWASWCGCRADLTLWQSLHESTRDHGLTIVAIALDQPESARPWIEAAKPAYPCLIDRDHRTAELYNLVNVPQAVWIDETGRMVRPPETAGLTDGFRAMDRKSFSMPQATREERERARTEYVNAIRDWVIRGAASPFALDEQAVTARLALPDAAIAEAHAHFRLGLALLRNGQGDEAETEFAQASKMHPDSWAIWRQTAAKDGRGLAVSEAFWKRVDALGGRPYYAPAELSHRKP